MTEENIERSANLIRSKSLDKKRAGLRSLAKMKSPEAMQILGEVVESREPPIADEALTLLANISGEDATRAMGTGLFSPDPFWRSWVLYTLGKRKEPEALKWVFKATTDEDPGIRQTAVRILNNAAKKRSEHIAALNELSIDRIFSALDRKIVLGFLSRDRPASLRLGAIRWLGGVNGNSAAKMLVSFCSNKDQAFRKTAISSLEGGGRFRPELALPLLKNADPEIRSRGLKIFGYLSGKKGGKKIAKLLEDSNPVVRLTAVGCLCEVADSGAIEPISGLLMDPDLQVRHKVVESLAGFKCERVVTFLIQAAFDSNDEIAGRAVFGLADREVFTPELEDHYIRILKDGITKPELSIEDVDSFCKIVGILESSRSIELLNILVHAANSSGRQLRRTAITAIDCYPDHQRLSTLRQLVSTDDPTVLKSVALGLGGAGDSAGVIPLIRATLECSRNVRKKALELLQRLTDIKDLPLLIKLLQSRWPSVKKFAAEQIIDMDSPELIEPLLEAMKNKNADLQLIIIQALAGFTYDKRVIECLLANISQGVISLRQRAVEILGDARVEEATEPLIRVLGNKFLSKKAEKALLRIGNRKGILEIKRRRLKKEYIAIMISQENPQE